MPLPHLRLRAVHQWPAAPPIPGVDGGAFVGTAYRFADGMAAAVVRGDFGVWMRVP